MKNQIANGKVIDYTVPSGGVSSGDVVVANELAGIAVTDGAENDVIGVDLCGVFSVPKGGAAFAQGEPVYWNSGTTQASTTDTFPLLGHAYTAAAGGDSEVSVRLKHT